MTTAALIIAAGATPNRANFDPLKEVGDMSAVKRMILVFRQAGVRLIVLVVGRNDERLTKHVSRMGVVCLANEKRAKAEMFDSVKVGLGYLRDKCDRVQVTPVNYSLFSAGTVRLLEACEKQVAFPLYRQRTGHPIQLDVSLFDGILAYQGAGGLARAVESQDATQDFIEVDDEGVRFDVDQRSDYQRLLERHSLNRLQPMAQGWVTKGETGYGPEQHRLLELVADAQSLRRASERMGISYSKGWRMVKEMERMFGYTIVESRQGGKQGGHSEITAQGRELMARYAAFSAELEEKAAQAFERHFT